MAAALRSLLAPGVLTILAVLQLSSSIIYVRRGSDITDCSMKCPGPDGVLQLYRTCGGHETRLLELWCEDMWLSNSTEPRLRYNTGTGCWTLRDAGKNDSCVYTVVYDHKGNISRTTLPITVLDAEISGLVSLHDEYGEYVPFWIALSFVAMACIPLLVMCLCCKKPETEDMERRTEETRGQISSSQMDRPGVEEEKTREKRSLLITIRQILGRIRKDR
ncbi:uncharacterized protein ACNLHF_008603 isoform 3-T3 [Anomaloglossus baeobatrachus]|uniref:uncharacterized protein LOC142280852 isoform X3 n=1 Tax=Anomaloglossus baeobatrachus TaxID=238106 RepID=UPI003F5028C7